MGNPVDPRIVRFIRRHHVLTLATDGPYCSHAFYCYEPGRNRFVFAASADTHHARQMTENPRVALAIAFESHLVGKLRGMQVCGTAHAADESDRRAYLRRFPFAALAELTLWAVEPDFMKFTDNTLGFGKKLIWNR